MKRTRREIIASMIGAFGVVGVIMTAPRHALACLAGTWKVHCPRCRQNDIVEDITCNHTCENCGGKAFSDGNGYIVCPVGHANYVRTGNKDERNKWLTSYKCRIRGCGRECLIKPFRR